jgi:hypothetical protein
MRPQNIPRRVYGILGVGKWAQFMEYAAPTSSLVALKGADENFTSSASVAPLREC